MYQFEAFSHFFFFFSALPYYAGTSNAGSAEIMES